MKSSFWVNTEKLMQLQEMVKQFDLRFIGNPIISGERSYVTIDSDHLPVEQCLAFRKAWDRVTTPIVEQRATKRKLLGNKINSVLNSARLFWTKHVC
jgi:hypothetical protein